MLLLALNTATVETAIALLEMDAKKTTALYSQSWPSKFDEAEKLQPQLDKIMKVLAKKKAVLEGIFVVAGPGSFTGLRIGVTTANILGAAAGAPLYACDTFSFLSARVPEKLRDATAILLRAGGDFCAIQLPGSKNGRSAGRGTRKSASASANAISKSAPGISLTGHQIVPISDLPAILIQNPTIKYVLADLRAEELKKYQLPQKVKWLPKTKLLTFSEAVGDTMETAFKKSLKPSSLIVPIYLQPPKITKSSRLPIT